MSDKEQQADPRYRKYVQLIERNLQSFDAVNEWADIISFLGRLLKSFQAYPQFSAIPHKHIVAKRLAQCLNPGFPAGVHQKTLDVYAYLFDTMGTDGLASDLSLWSIGLFPFVQYAATHVKPQLLNIFERYYYPLGSQLRPAVRGLIIALLPALEEEGSDAFDRVVAMLDRLMNTVEASFFYTCFWLVMINDGNLRAPALNYLLRRLPKITNKEDVALVIGGPENVGLMVRAFAATLADTQLLVQRGMLELLVQNYALKHRTLGHDDLITLTQAALSIVLRRDMSLNRRLYAWLLGGDAGSQAQLAYFHQFAEPASIQAMRDLFYATHTQQWADMDKDDHANWAATVQAAQKPYKVLISLMDKWELGQPIVHNIFIDALRSLYDNAKHGLPEQEILQTANMWMEIVEPYMIWRKLFGVLQDAYPSEQKTLDKSRDQLDLVDYALHAFKLTDEDIKQMHLPLVATAMAQSLQVALGTSDFKSTLSHTTQYLDILLHILQQLPESVYLERQRKASVDDASTVLAPEFEFRDVDDAVAYARHYYMISDDDTTKDGATRSTHDDDGDLTSQSQPSAALVDTELPAWMNVAARPSYGAVRGHVLKRALTRCLIRFISAFVHEHLSPKASTVVNGMHALRIHATAPPPPLEKILHDSCAALLLVARHWTDNDHQKDHEKTDHDFLQPLKRELADTLLICCQSEDFGVVDTALTVLSQLIKRHNFLGSNTLKDQALVKRVMDRLWSFLSPSSQLLHMRTTELIWLVTDMATAHHVEAMMARYLKVADDAARLDNYERFGVFWELSENMVQAANIFTRPMFIMLDLLREGASPLDRRAGESWIRCHLKSYARLLQPFMTTLLSAHILRRHAEKHIPYVYQQLYPAPAAHPEQQQAVHVAYFVYLRSFDMDIVDYLLTTLATLIRYGGMGVLKACKNYAVGAASQMANLIEQSLGISIQDHPHLSFLELLVHIGIRFIESEPCDKLVKKMIKPVRQIQLHACDLLYLIISKLDHVDMQITSLIQHCALSKLLFCIASGDLDIQQRLLHLAQASMAITAAQAVAAPAAASTAAKTSSKRRSSITYGPDGAASSPSSPTATSTRDTQQAAVQLAHDTCNLYLKCVTDAFHTPSNRRLLPHWMDFVLVTLPHVRQAFRQVMLPLLAALCEQIHLCNETVRLLMHGGIVASTSNTPATLWHHQKQQQTRPLQLLHGSQETLPLIQEHGAVLGGPENDILIFLNGLEKLLMVSLLDRGVSDLWQGTHTKNKQLPLLLPRIDDQVELFGLVQWLQLHYDLPSDHLHYTHPRQIILLHLPLLLHILLDVWRVFRQPHWSNATVRVLGQAKKGAVWTSFAFAADRVKARLEATFEFLYKHHPVDVIEAFCEIFFIENPVALEYEAPSNAYELYVMEILTAIPTSTSQQVLAMLLDCVRQRSPGIQHRRRTIIRQGKLTDTALLRFAEIYCQELIKKETLASLWPLIHPFAKEYLSQASSSKQILPGLLRFLTTALTSFMEVSEDKKTRKDAVDLYQRFVDYGILLAGRAFDQGLWLRRTALYDDNDDNAASSAHTSPYATPLASSSSTTTHHANTGAHTSSTGANASSGTVLHHPAAANAVLSQDMASSPGASSLSSNASASAASTVLASATAMVTATLEGSLMPLFGYTGGAPVMADQPLTKDAVASPKPYRAPILMQNTQNAPIPLDADHATAMSMDMFYPRNLTLTQVPELERLATWKAKEEFMILHLNHYLADKILPHIRVLLGGEQDRVNAVLANLVYYVIGPTLRSRQASMLASPANTFRFGRSNLHGPSLVLDQVVAMARMPFTYKTWRKDIWDAFNDGKFFQMTTTNAEKWSHILTTVFSVEKERFAELLSKINTAALAGSAAFPFTSSNRDHDTHQRAMYMRRLSFLLFAAQTDQYVTQLPLIQEKLVDLLKLDHAEAIHSEIYLCLRVILLRFSQKHLVNFWPVLVSELMRLFSFYLASTFQDRPHEAQIALAGCKFLDLLCTLEMDSFQVYQWMFICDTVDVLIKQHGDAGHASMTEQLDAKLASEDRGGAVATLQGDTVVAPCLFAKRRPMLTMPSISSIQQLRVFVSSVSVNAYNASYMLCKPDIPFIEDLLLQDLLDVD